MHNKAMLITVPSLMIIHYLCLKIRHKNKSIMIQHVSIWILCRSTTLQWKAMTGSHVDTYVGGESFQVQLWIQRLCKQCASEHHHPQCCWPNHPHCQLALKDLSQTTSSHIYFFLGQWPAPWALSKKCVKRKSALTTTMAISKAMMYSREFSCILSEAFLCGSKWTDTGAFILMCCVPYRYSPLTCSTGNILLAKFKSLHDLQISSALEHLELGQDPGAQTCPNVQHDVLAWRVGRDYSYSNCLFFPELPKIQRNCGSSERHFLVRDISNAHPPDC